VSQAREGPRDRAPVDHANAAPGRFVPAACGADLADYAGVARDRGCSPRTSRHRQEAIISADKASSWVYAEEFLPEDEVLLAARERAAQLGASTVTPGTGAVLTLLAAASKARAAVEIGTGTGVASLYLLRGMPADGVLTTIDSELEHHRAAKESFADAGIRSTRTRTISGRPLDVLPRLTDAAYDLVLLSLTSTGGLLDSAPEYLAQSLRLLRPGGVLVIDHALWHDRVADPARRDEATTVVRELGRAVRADDRLQPALLPVGDGVLAAVRR